MTEYKVWAFARSAAPNLPALEEQLAEVMREADRRGYIIVNSCMEQSTVPNSGDLIVCHAHRCPAGARQRRHGAEP